VSNISFHLPTLLHDWRLMLTSWAADGSLGAAAREALRLDGEPAQLTALISQWAAGDFSGLPPIEVLEGWVLPGAAGAYAISTGTIYLNGDWLASVSEDRVIAVLTEELGHHLDGLLNVSDTPGDEGEIFAALVRQEEFSPGRLFMLRTENDCGTAILNGRTVAFEQATASISLVASYPACVTPMMCVLPATTPTLLTFSRQQPILLSSASALQPSQR
jgi:hypothetical protein